MNYETDEWSFAWLKHGLNINGLDGCDAEIKHILTLLNTVPGVVTSTSCASHPSSKPTHATKSLRSRQLGEEFYIRMGVRDEGFSNLVSIFSILRANIEHEAIHSDEQVYQDVYRATRHGSLRLVLGTRSLNAHTEGSWKAVSLEATLAHFNPMIRDTFLVILADTLEAWLKNQQRKSHEIQEI